MKSQTIRAAMVTASCAVLSLTAGCATLPQAGPSGSRITREGERGQFILREVIALEALPATPVLPDFQPLPESWQTRTEALSAGDVISVVYYEVGVRVFAGSANAQGTYDPSAKSTTIGPVVVEQDGTIKLPYSGVIKAAGLTPRQLAAEIEGQLRSKSEDPQVLVRLEAANGSSVMVGGEIARPGRVTLSGARERLLDVISLAGGVRGAPDNVLVTVERKGLVSQGPLEKLTYENFGGTRMEPADRVQLIRRSAAYTVLGSANRINRFDLPLRPVPLVEALAMAGGPNENTANPAAVFVFRYQAGEAGQPAAAAPVVYHINMLKPSSYFLAQQFYLADKDVIYVGGAEANQPSKLLGIIGQVLGPAAVARQLTN